MLIASTFASAACGIGLESSRIIRELAQERGGRPDGTLWFTGRKLPVADVAQVNAVMGDAAASDDSDLRNIVHAGTPLTAASLAICRAQRCQWRSGTDGHGTWLRGGGTITIDAARCEQLAHAIALSATSIGGLASAADTWSRANITLAWRLRSGSRPHWPHRAAIERNWRYWRRGVGSQIIRRRRRPGRGDRGVR